MNHEKYIGMDVHQATTERVVGAKPESPTLSPSKVNLRS
jgi:hypothetical protein